ncbi:MAG: methionyl-tRNA formyltransferase [Gammaproteobacteria bacterium]|nr:methionyl-tRNA formyltransferase [Gammaproteobacteria bacterium]NNJ72650.1 methionyl-tRNA formyltransferase [Enterobacterales bacterium]
MTTNPRLVFAGTPDFAARHLAALLAHELKPVAVYTQPDRPAGRGRKLQASAVKTMALEANLNVYQPESLKTAEVQQQLAELEPDLLIVVAYGLILPQAVLDIPKLGCINVHGSLLPKWRGAAPIQRAIEAGDKTTGVTIMQMDAGLDTGDMLLKAECAITDIDTSASLYEKLAELGAALLPEAVNKLIQGELTPEPQDDNQSSHAHKLSKAEGRINWSDDAPLIDRKIRAYTPWPGSQCQLNDQVLKCHARLCDTQVPSAKMPGTILSVDSSGLVVATGHGQIQITQLQFPGKRMLAISDLLNAYADKLAPGCQFT